MASVSGANISPTSTCVPLCPSRSSVAAGCGSEIKPEGGSDSLTAEGRRRFLPVKTPHWQELVLMVTNNEEWDEEVG